MPVKFLKLKKRFLWLAVVVIISIPVFSMAAQDGCMRGEANSLFVKEHREILSHQFKRVSRTEATEDITLSSGVSLHVTHGGCEYYIITFRFESGTMLGNDQACLTVFKAAEDLIRGLDRLHPRCLFKLGLAADTLHEAAMSRSGPQIGKQYPVDGDGTDFLQTKIQVVKAGRNGKTGFIEVEFSKGPL